MLITVNDSFKKIEFSLLLTRHCLDSTLEFWGFSECFECILYKRPLDGAVWIFILTAETWRSNLCILFLRSQKYPAFIISCVKNNRKDKYNDSSSIERCEHYSLCPGEHKHLIALCTCCLHFTACVPVCILSIIPNLILNTV